MDFVAGSRFGYLELVTHVKGSRWACKCDCGDYVVVYARDLETGRRNSCGCANGRKAPGREIVIRERRDLALYQLQKRYEKHGKEFGLAKEQFEQLITGNCFYCGIEPMQEHVLPARENDATKKFIFNYNGIDRKDSNAGYVDGNCVSCCFDCNRAKMDSTPDEFLNWVKRISLYQAKQLGI